MPSATTDRVERNTAALLNRKFEQQLNENVSKFAKADRRAIDQRLAELDREWNIERLIETEAPLMIGLGMALGTAHDRKWFALSAFAAGMVILHNLQAGIRCCRSSGASAYGPRTK